MRCVLALLCVCLCPFGNVKADTFDVTNTDDSGPGSLRAAILAADQLGGPHTINVTATGTINLATALPVVNKNFSNEISIEGPGAADLTVDGGGANRALFVNQGDVLIKGITIANGSAQGGSGTDGGGGGLGAGGGLFVNAGANVTVENVEFQNNSATGGNGGDESASSGGGGGGGLGGNGGNAGAGGGAGTGGGGGGGFGGNGGNADDGGGGGGGLENDGGAAFGGTGGLGDPVGGGHGGNTNTAGGSGDVFGGGGGAGDDLLNDKPGGMGGDFGGGGGGEGLGTGGTGGNGGFGGGGGAGGNLATGGAGGFGAGGGAGGTNGTAGAAGMLGGAGGAGGTGPGAGGGGGGAGLGGAVFVRSGGTLIIRNSGIDGSAITAGSGGSAANGDNGVNGSAQGQDLFLNGTVGQVDVTTGSSAMTGSISGTGSLTKTGDGALVLSGTNNYSGGTTVVGGNLQGDTSSLQGDITNNAAVTFDQGFDGTYADIISRTGDLTKLGAGKLTLSGANSYSGGTTITAGMLQGDTTSLQGNIENNASLVFNQGSNDTFTDIISGTGDLTKLGAGTLTLAGANTYGGGTTVTAGTLQGDTTSLQGDITNNASLIFNQDADGTFGDIISGTGSLTKLGSGIVTLSGANTYGGGTTVTAGTLQGDTTSLQGDIITNSSLIFNQDADGTFGDIISGTGTLAKLGSGIVTLSGANTYGGGTTVTAGTLQGDTTSLQGDITNDASLVFNQDTDGTFGDIITGLGTLTKLGSGIVTLSGANTYSGGTTVTAGTLQGDTTSLQGDITNDASLVFDQAADGTYAGVISGTGGLTKQGSGIVTLSGQNLFTGGAFLNAGGLSVASDDLLGDVTSGLSFDGGTLITTGSFTTARDTTLNVGGGTIDTEANSIDHAGTISGDGLLTKTGTGTLTLSTANTHTGGTAINGGTVAVAADDRLGDSSSGISMDGGTLQTTASFGTNRNVMLDVNGGTIDTLNNALVFSGQFTGAGDLTKLGSGLLTLAGNSTYAGQTSVNAGVMAVNGTITSNVVVNDGGTLGGSGTVGGLTVNSGGAIAPGNSIGTTSVSGDYAHEAGASYNVEIDASGNSDRIAVTGTATINGGDVRVTSAAGDYINGSTYTILTSGSGVTGTYASVSDDLALFEASLIYSSNQVVLLLNRAATNFTADAGTPNQVAVATLLDQESLTAEGDFANLLQEIFGLSTADRQTAFDALGGSIHGSAGIATIMNTGMFLNSLNNRVSKSQYAGFDDGSVVRGQSPCASCGGIGTTGWIRAIGQNGTIDTVNGVAGIDYGVSGQAVGIEQNLTDWAMLGASVYSSQLHTTADASNTHVDSDRVALYGRSRGDLLQIFGAVSFGHHAYDASRHLVIGGLDRSAKGTYDGQEFGTYWELSAPRTVGSFIVEPLIGLQVVTLTRADDFRETGAGAMNLNVNEARTTSIRPSFGARTFLPQFDLGLARILGELHGRYMYEGGDTAGTVTAGFNNNATGTFSIQGANVGQHFGLLGTSLTAELTERTSVFLAYDGLFADASTAHAGNLGLTFVW